MFAKNSKKSSACGTVNGQFLMHAVVTAPQLVCIKVCGLEKQFFHGSD